jgi:tripartite-type tricarboxylate transporter receptor subunit TctC
VMLALEARIKILHVPFKGAGPAVSAMLGGETDLLFANTGVFLGHIKAGKLRPIAVAALTRLPLFPDVPTLNEAGFPGFESVTIYGLLAPAGTPRPIVNRLHDELAKIIMAPDSVARLAGVGAIPVANTPEQFAEANRREIAKWGRIIRENGIKAD